MGERQLLAEGLSLHRPGISESLHVATKGPACPTAQSYLGPGSPPHLPYHSQLVTEGTQPEWDSGSSSSKLRGSGWSLHLSKTVSSTTIWGHLPPSPVLLRKPQCHVMQGRGSTTLPLSHSFLRMVLPQSWDPNPKPSKLCPHPPTDNSDMTRVKMAALIILAEAPQAPLLKASLATYPPLTMP